MTGGCVAKVDDFQRSLIEQWGRYSGGSDGSVEHASAAIRAHGAEQIHIHEHEI